MLDWAGLQVDAVFMVKRRQGQDAFGETPKAAEEDIRAPATNWIVTEPCRWLGGVIKTGSPDSCFILPTEKIIQPGVDPIPRGATPGRTRFLPLPGTVESFFISPNFLSSTAALRVVVDGDAMQILGSSHNERAGACQ
jgi:hypothetical protein